MYQVHRGPIPMSRSRRSVSWPQLAQSYLRKRRKLTVRIFLEVCLDQLRVLALADRFPKRQFDFPDLGVTHANSVLRNCLEAKSGERCETALRILLEIGFILP